MKKGFFILKRYLPYLSKSILDKTIQYYSKIEECVNAVERYKNLLSWSPEKLIKFIEQDGDEDDLESYINIFLWKQKNGEFDSKYRINYTFDIDSYNYSTDRYMSMTGYEKVDELEHIYDTEYIATKIKHISYKKFIDKYLLNFKKFLFVYEDGIGPYEEDVIYPLVISLNAINPKLKNEELLPGTIELFEFILDSLKNKSYPLEIDVSEFTMFAYDIKYPEEKTWDIYKDGLINNSRGAYDFPAYILGLEMYGEKALDEFKKIKVLGFGSVYNFLEMMGIVDSYKKKN